jgi:glyoxylase-like metal-dependent hydrolase (beta-lactamase superfamily II)
MRAASEQLEYEVVPVTPFQQNCSVLRCTATGRGAVVDPGGDLPLVMRAVEAGDVEVEKILVTHAHVDHAAGVADLAEELGVPIEGPHPEDQFWIDSLAQQAQMFGLGGPARAFTPDRWLAGGDVVTVGELELLVRHCPGHTPGHVIFAHPDSNLALVGDVLFQGSIGRTDFPKGDFDTLIRSIREQLLPLGDDVVFVSGHGPLSTFGEERRSNPFLLAPARFRGLV